MTNVVPDFLFQTDVSFLKAYDSSFQRMKRYIEARPYLINFTNEVYTFLAEDLKKELLFQKETNLYGTGLNGEIDTLISGIGFSLREMDTSSSFSLQFGSNFNSIIVKTDMENLIHRAESKTIRPPLSEVLYFNYSRIGEKRLNQEVSLIGDALNVIKQVSFELNRIEGVLAINPGEEFLNERGELLITSQLEEGDTASDAPGGGNSLFYNQSVFQKVEKRYLDGSLTDLSAIDVLKDSLKKLEALSLSIPNNSDQRKVVEDIISKMSMDYNIDNWGNQDSSWTDRLGGDETKGELYWKTDFESFDHQPKNFARLFMDKNFRKDIADTISVIQTQSDIQKQELSKLLFLYQEFVKSSASLVDLIAKSTKNIARNTS